MSINLDNLFDTLMKDTQNARNNRVAKALSFKESKENSSGLKINNREESRVMEVCDSKEYTWGMIGDNSN